MVVAHLCGHGLQIRAIAPNNIKHIRAIGYPYTGQDQIGANKFVINKVKILNYRWIIADFSDGEYWGEVLLKYFVNEDGSKSFEVNQSLLYQKQK